MEVEGPFTLDSLKEQIAQARQSAARRDASEPRAVGVRYDPTSHRIIVDLRNGTTFIFPPDLAQGLAEASAAELDDVIVTPSGEGLRWEKLDVDLGLPALLVGIFGTKAWMAETGRAGGRATSTAKANAARKNGEKGGRPRKAAP